MIVEAIFTGIILVLVGASIFILRKDYLASRKRRHDSIRDMLPCICGHTRWIHGATASDPLASRCHDFHWDYPCKCSGYRMDNLVYLERIDRHEIERISDL